MDAQGTDEDEDGVAVTDVGNFNEACTTANRGIVETEVWLVGLGQRSRRHVEENEDENGASCYDGGVAGAGDRRDELD